MLPCTLYLDMSVNLLPCTLICPSTCYLVPWHVHQPVTLYLDKSVNLLPCTLTCPSTCYLVPWQVCQRTPELHEHESEGMTPPKWLIPWHTRINLQFSCYCDVGYHERNYTCSCLCSFDTCDQSLFNTVDWLLFTGVKSSIYSLSHINSEHLTTANICFT